MNWSKAKTILIVALLITNMFLIFTYGFKDDTSGEVRNEDTLLDVLASQNIFLNVDIPEKHDNMPVLSIQYAETDQNLVDRCMKNVAILPENAGQKEYIAASEAFMQECGYLTETAVLLRVESASTGEISNRKIVKFANEYTGIAVEESYMTCTFENGKMVDFDRYWLEPLNLSDKKIRTISAAAALITFMSEAGADAPIVVEDIKLVYWLKDAGFNADTAVSDMAFPAWRITYNGGEVRHVDAVQQ